ncbi:MAG: hypothetical protein ACI83D_000202 [Planctomycetota bacterium]|jgi:hypothetical protein
MRGGILGVHNIVNTKSNNQKARTSVVVVISDSGVYGASVLCRGGLTVPLVSTVVYEQVPFQNEFSYEYFYTMLRMSLHRILSKLELETKGVLPDTVEVILSAPWSISEVHTIDYKKKQAFTFSQQLAMNLVESDFRESIKNLDDVVGREEGHHGLIEHFTMHVLLNGYFTYEPVGKQAKEVEITTLLSYTDPGFLLGIRKHVERFFPETPYEIRSMARTHMIAWRSLFPYLSDYLIVDVRGEVTELILVGRNSIDGVYSFPVGFHTIKRMLMHRLVRSAGEVDALLRVHMRSQNHEHVHILVQKGLEAGSRLWLNALRKVLQEMGSSRLLPKDIFLLAPVLVRDELYRVLRAELFSEYIPTHAVPIIQKIERSHGLGLVQYNTSTHRNFDIDTAILGDVAKANK